jgi:beta-N-acetylhexosaminidase
MLVLLPPKNEAPETEARSGPRSVAPTLASLRKLIRMLLVPNALFVGLAKVLPAPGVPLMQQGRRRLSRRSFLQVVEGGLATAFLACSATQKTEKPMESSGNTSTPISAPQAAITPTPVSRANLEEKIGQMLLLGFGGVAVEPAGRVGVEVKSGRMGNAVLFDVASPGTPSRNINSPAQLSTLSRELQSLASRRMLIAVDQEGGQVARLGPSNGFPPTVSAQYLGQRNDLATTREYGSRMAKTLAQSGINLNLAPVVDVNINPTNPVVGVTGRTFSADPDVVAEHALAFIQAHREAGVLCAIKHFPGHGSSALDSHLGLPDVTRSWSRKELIPFQRLVAARQADVIMTGHLFNANLDPEFPATLSRRTITDLLRGELGFEGVVLSDDMQMAAITQKFGFAASLELAINAGVDMISIAGDQTQPDAFSIILEAVRSGRISETRIDQAHRRISSLKAHIV